MKDKNNCWRNIFNKENIIIFLITFIILFLALLSFYPGIMTVDGNYQWKQIEDNHITDAHPFFSTFFPMLLSKIWNSKTVVIVFQILLFSIIWASICKTLRKENNFLRQIVYTIILCFVPIIFGYALTFWKDIIYSYMLLLLALLFYIGIKNKYNYTLWEMFLLALTLIVIMSYRHNGIIVTIFSIITLIILFLKNKVILKKIIFFILALIIVYTSILIPKAIIVEQDETIVDFKYSMPVFILGSLISKDVITDTEDLEYLNTVMSLDIWKENYNPYLINSLAVSNKPNVELIKETYDRLINILIKYSIKNPSVIIEHYWKVDSLLLNPMSKGYVYTFSFSEWGSEGGGFDEITTPITKIGNSMFMKLINRTVRSEFAMKIFYMPALPFYISIIMAIVLVKKRKSKLYLLPVLPMLFNTISLIPTNVAQDLRYVYINYLTFFFIIAIMLFNKKGIVYEEKNNKKKNGKKTLIIIPAYNEGQAIKNVVENVYDKNPDCDVVIVNDGSKDNTLEEARKTKAIVLDLPSNLGIGGAVQTGYLYAYKNNYDMAIQIDGDGQHNPEYIGKMRKLIIEENYDMVIGSRFVEKTTFQQTFFRMLGINITSSIIKTMTGYKIYDTTSGYRAVNKDIIAMFANKYPYDYPEPDTNMQMILKGKQIKEIPVEMNKRTTGVSSISPLKSISYMLKVSLSLLLSNIKKD